MSPWLSDNLWVGLVLLAGFIHLSGVASALHAAVRTRTAQGAVAWSISLLTFPYLALPLYWVFGRGKFHGYVAARRSGDLKIHSVAAALHERIEGGQRALLPPEAVHRRGGASLRHHPGAGQPLPAQLPQPSQDPGR